jgi:hypothetical protein
MIKGTLEYVKEIGEGDEVVLPIRFVAVTVLYPELLDVERFERRLVVTISGGEGRLSPITLRPRTEPSR